MAKNNNGLKRLLGLIAWLTGVLVSLAVGFAMTDSGPLNSIPYIPQIVTAVAGWIVVVITIVAAILAIIEAFR